MIDGISGSDRISSNFMPNPYGRKNPAERKSESFGMSFGEIIKVNEEAAEQENRQSRQEQDDRENKPREKTDADFKSIRETLFNFSLGVFYTQAKKISLNGYYYGTKEYGVKSVSDKIIMFAMTLSCGDASAADQMIISVGEGYKKAAEAFGGVLPKICEATCDETLKRLEAWKNTAL